MPEGYAPRIAKRVDQQHRLFVDGKWRQDWYEGFENQDFARWLREKGVRLPIFEYRRDLYRLIISSPLFPDKPLPPGYWYKGGCARALFFKRLGIPCPKPRDIDLVQQQDIAVKHSDAHPELQEADAIEKFGGYYEDADGYIESTDPAFEDYFFSRDFTINEVLANDHEILFTKAALQDALERQLRVTSAQRNQNDRYQNSVKTLARLIRFSIDLSHVDPDHPWMIDASAQEGLTQEILDKNTFYIFLHLDRILERGLAWGEWYLEEWHKHGFFLAEETVLDFAKHLSQNLKNYTFSSSYLQEMLEPLPEQDQES